MNFIIEGLVLGLALTILLGPIFVALTQASIQGGSKAGLTVGLGVWVSDALFIVLCYAFIQRLSRVVADSSFVYWMGLVGALVLITFGIGTFLKQSDIDHSLPTQKLSTKSYLGLFTKGFLVNTINPFTFAFWISVISTYVIGHDITNQEAWLFFGAIMFVIVSTDVLKVRLAKLLRDQLQSSHIKLFSKVAGIVLVVFGVVLLIRVGVV